LEEGLISKEGNQLLVSFEQYKKLKELIAAIIDIE
jgi:CRP/FNR family cyclic AMP-dependent transcriptional regulator